jgi:hypothetical protein
MTGKLTTGDWIYITGFTFFIVFTIYLSKKESTVASNTPSPSDTQES